MQTLTACNAKITSTRTASGQFQGQFKGAMERYMHMRGSWVRFGEKLTWPCHDTRPTVSIPLGQAHINSGVVMDVAAFKVCHSVFRDHHATAL